jgi:hypothetical protein
VFASREVASFRTTSQSNQQEQQDNNDLSPSGQDEEKGEFQSAKEGEVCCEDTDHHTALFHVR